MHFSQKVANLLQNNNPLPQQNLDNLTTHLNYVLQLNEITIRSINKYKNKFQNYNIIYTVVNLFIRF